MNEEKGKGKRITENIRLGPDGVYRWTYELSLLKNPTVFLMVWKLLFFIFLGIFFVIILTDLHRRGMETLPENLKFLGLFLIGMTFVVGLGYALYAVVMGGKYIVEFEMDENGVNHRQTASQAKKAKKLGVYTAMAGAAGRNPTTVGVGVNAQRTEMYSAFSEVRAVKSFPRRHLIKVNGLLSRNQVYAADGDFAFVEKYIRDRCVNAKNKPETN